MVLKKFERMALLSDFYGKLLTARQQETIRFYYEQDLSLGEIAEQFGVTRQAVYDILRRSQKTLLNFEEKLGLIRRYTKQRELLETMQCRLADLGEALARQDPDKTRAKELGELEQLVTQMLESF